MERLSRKVPFTEVRVDDILVSGRNEEDSRRNLNTVFTILSDNGVRLKLKKCVFVSSLFHLLFKYHFRTFWSGLLVNWAR